MSAIHPTKTVKTSFPPTEGDLEPQEPQKSSPKISKPADGETANSKTANNDLSEKLEIPSLDDMTSYLLSNEVIDKDTLPQLISKHNNAGIPEIQQGRNDFDTSQVLLRRPRDNIDMNLLLAQSMQEETKREIDMLFKIAQTMASNGEYVQAINYYNKIISLNEKNGSAWIAKGHCYAMLGQDFKALTTYQEAMKIVPSTQKDEQVWYGIGLLYQKFEEWNNAELAFKNALRLEPEINLKAELLYNLGMVLKSKGEFAESAKTLTNSILTGAFPPTRMVDILCQNGNVQEKISDMEGALKTYKYALMIEENAKPLLCAGWLCFQLDKIEQCLGHMKKAESLVPEDMNISYVIARCHLKLKQHTTAYDCLHRCLSKEPTNSVYWGSLGILFAELNQLKQAYESLSKALKLDPKCPENFYNLGCLFELSGQPNDALSMYEKCIDFQPNFHLALNRMRLVHISQKSGSVEVQFKHAPFILNLNKEAKVEKPLFSFSQAGSSLVPVREKSLTQELEYAQRLKEAALKQNLRESSELLKLKEQHAANLKPVRLDQLASKLVPTKNLSEAKGLLGDVEQDVTSLKLSRPLLSDQNNTKLPSVQSLSSSLSGLNSFSFLQNNYNNVNNFVINPVMNLKQSLGETEQLSSLLPNRAKTDELSAGLKGTPNDLAKQLSGLQALIAKNSAMLKGSIAQNYSGDSLQPIKNVSSPVVIKPGQQKDGFKRTDNQSEIKLNGHSALKVTHKLNKNDQVDEDEPEIQKKVKLQTTSKSAANVPAEN